jgi:multiple sugar transport system substrate-binding protein
MSNARRALRYILILTGLLGAIVSTGQFLPMVQAAAPVEIAYNTFLDPTNTNDPRAAAQNQMIAEFERANPNIHVKVVVDPSGANGARTLRTHSDSPDVVRTTQFLLPELAATGGMQPLDDLVRQDGIDQTDWLLPMDTGKVQGHIYALQQDYRIPILIYRKHLLEEAGVRPPRSWDEVCAVGSKLTKGNIIGYAIPIGVTGGVGGAQAFGEFLLSTLLAGRDGKYFADDHKAIAFSQESFHKAAQLIKELFVKCKASTPATLQFGFNEVHDGLRAGTIAMATFAVYRYRTIQQQGAGDDLAWAPPPGYTADDPQVVYGYQATLNAFSKHKDEAWKLLKFMTSPTAEALAGRGGEVVARASAYNDAYFASPQARVQREWADLIKKRGRIVNYSLIQSTFHQIVADAFQRMILRNSSPEDAYNEVLSKYNEALSNLK